MSAKAPSWDRALWRPSTRWRRWRRVRRPATSSRRAWWWSRNWRRWPPCVQAPPRSPRYPRPCARAALPGRPGAATSFEDARLHREVALAAENPLLLFLYDHLAAIRRVMTWDRPRSGGDGPPADHPSFAEHDRIVAAIAARDPAAARREMAAHVTTVHAAMAPA
ncbi:FCD domain-containing protein (plasmid) [Methylobacterium oryzae CBMB20]